MLTTSGRVMGWMVLAGAYGSAGFAAGSALRKLGTIFRGTTFVEGLVYFHGRWFLYYGCADSLVAVATAP